ncbi:HepT-like ribonuclease domain-containing protein [Mesotoga sp.]
MYLHSSSQRYSWRALAGTRDRPIHDYSGVNYDIVWAVIV